MFSMLYCNAQQQIYKLHQLTYFLIYIANLIDSQNLVGYFPNYVSFWR